MMDEFLRNDRPESDKETLFVDGDVLLGLILATLTRRSPHEAHGSAFEEMMMNRAGSSFRRGTKRGPFSPLVTPTAGDAMVLMVGRRHGSVTDRRYASAVTIHGVGRRLGRREKKLRSDG